jgi:DNA-binding Xre family transcriptional regulator
MPVRWNLRECLRERGFVRAAQVSKIVRERTGYVLSTQAVCDLLNDEPKMLRLETGQALCDAFYCRLSDFFEVLPSAVSRSHRKTNRPPDPLSSQESTNEAGRGMRTDGQQGMSRENNIDFAALFPDARHFSSKQATEDQAY